jgi:hypothetical protein
MRFLIVAFLVTIILGCHNERTDESPGTELGKVDDRLEEASGLVASIANPGFLWAVNDSGNTAEIFLIDLQAQVRLVCTLAHIENRDWEDITLARGPDNKSYLYIGDIGDNFLKYDDKVVYRFEEPVLNGEAEQIITHFDTFTFRMPKARFDAETLLVDPVTQDLFIFSKQRRGAVIYQAPQPLRTDTMTLKKVLTISLSQIVAASITVDGKKVLLKSYDQVFYFEKPKSEKLVECLVKVHEVLAYTREPQGEAIAWSSDGTEFYTLSESTWLNHASLLAYKQKNNTTQ